MTSDPDTSGPQSFLCKDCRRAIDLWGSEKDIAKAGDGRPSRGPPETVLHQTEIALRDRVATGCRLCIQIYNSFEGETGSFEEASFARRHGTTVDGPELWGYMRAWRQGGPPNDDYEKTDLAIRRWRPRVDMQFSVRLHRVRDGSCTDCSGGMTHDIGTKNPPPWDLMKKWLQDCIENHEGPCKPTGSTFVPSRLLNVGTIPDPVLRLELRDDLPPSIEYITLSHCWGPVVPKRLLLENLPLFRKCIPTEGLSKTFQDAIHTARVLGQQYLWIDSLCIIQNSSEDWQTEAKFMGQVYARGVCNLAAVAATEGSQGLFLDKPSLPQVVVEFDGKKDLWHLVENPGHHWDNILNFAPLNWRGWVFQERFLSTRVLSFGRSRVYWECGQRKCCELPGKGQTKDKDLTSDAWTDQSKAGWQALLNGIEIDDKDKAVDRWNDIVNHYTSHSAFTYVTDKLLAIGGLAARVQEATRCRYYAGVWEHNIQSQLMWNVGKYGAEESPSHSYVAPSWSWASINVPISRYRVGRGGSANYKPELVVEFLIFNIDLVTGNEFGQVKSGSLTLAGRLMFIENTGIFQPSLDDELRSGSIVLRFDRKENAQDGGHTPLFLLLMEEERREQSYIGGDLAIVPVNRDPVLQQKRVFRRVGFFEFWINLTKKNEIGELQDKFEDTQFAQDLPVRKGKDGKSQYIVELI